MENYTGVKFNAVQCSGKLPQIAVGLYPEFKKTCDRLKSGGMAEGNAGNISIKSGKSFVITSSGSNLASLVESDLVFVEKCDVDAGKVYYHGSKKPSSESIMHWLIYGQRPDTMAIIHAHDKLLTNFNLINGVVKESEREEPCGSVDLAKMAARTIGQSEQIIALKNHGYVAIGSDLDTVCDFIIDTHKQLLFEQDLTFG
jgi:L-fuculose-phosphate aldolase